MLRMSLPGARPLSWHRTVVRGRKAEYGEIGSPNAPLVLFLHGWGINQNTYAHALRKLASAGFHVVAPALPGFGGSSPLPEADISFEGFADWVDEFLSAVGAAEPALVVGHSFGGGVAISLAHAHATRVSRLVLVNSVGGSAWTNSGGRSRSLSERPLWDWGLQFPVDLTPTWGLARVLQMYLSDAIPNLLRNPHFMIRTAKMVRDAHLVDELEELRARGLPVLVLWGDRDKIVPRASSEQLCAALGQEGTVVKGSHSWMLSQPTAFVEAIAELVKVTPPHLPGEKGQPAAS